MDLVRAISKNTFYLIAGQSAIQVVSFFVSIALARHLGTEGLGQYSIAMAYLFFFAVIPRFSHESILAREMSVAKGKKPGILFAEACLLRFCLSIVSILLACFGLLLSKYSMHIKILILVASIELFVSFRSLFIAIFQKKMEMGIYALSNFFISLLMGVLTILIILLNGKVVHFILLNIFMTSVATLVYFFLVKNQLEIPWGLHKKYFYMLIRHSTPLALSEFFERVLYRMDHVMIGSLIGVVSLGLYRVCSTVVEALIFIPTALMTTLLPVLSSYFVNEPQKHLRITKLSAKYLSIIALPSALILSYFSPKILHLLFGKVFEKAAPILSVLALALPFLFIISLLRQVLISANKQKIVFYGAMVAAMVNISLNILLIPKWGAVGAAVATTFAYTIPLFFYIFDSVTRQFMLQVFMGVFRLFPAVIGLAACFFIIPVPWIWNILLSGFIYIILLLLTKGIDLYDLEVFKKVLSVESSSKKSH